MNIKELAQLCVDSINGGGTRITLVKPSKMPKGFPRGEFLSETGRGKVYSYDAKRVMEWMIKNALVGVKLTPKAAQ